MTRNSNRGSQKRGRGARQNISLRGFASMPPEQQREIARLGGRASHEQGTGHEWNSREAREAGRKGGLARGRNS
jgi:general stress protein YciG